METILKKPSLYNLLYKDVTEDINLYKVLLKNYKEIVEYGAGTGRITIPIAQEGKKVIAIDNESNMLDDLKFKVKEMGLEKNIIPIKADMITYVCDKKEKCVIMPLTVFNYILDDKEQEECLKNIGKYLERDGTLIIELLTKKTFLDLTENSESNLEYIKKIKTNYGYYEYWRTTTFDKNTNLIEQRRVFKHFNKENKNDSQEEFIWKNKFITYNTIKQELERNDFVIETAYGNCKLDPYNEDSEDLFIKAKKV